MGYAKHKMMEDEADDELVDFLQNVQHSTTILHHVVEGISKLAIDKGLKSLSEKQRGVIDRFVEDFKRTHNCQSCGGINVGGLYDYLYIADNRNRYCCDCQNRIDKFMEE